MSTKKHVDIVQLRDKQGSAREMVRFARRLHRVLNGSAAFVVNDRIDVAIISGADGVHLGQEDVEIKDARRLMGPKRLIGVSCQSMQHVKKAEQDGADYIGFGSVYKTLTKPERRPMKPGLLRSIARRANVPWFAIGGITVKVVSDLRTLGVSRVAVCRDILLATEPGAVAGRYQDILSGD